MAARVDLELGRELGVSAVVVQAAAAEHLSEPEHVFWTDAPGGQRRKEYTPAGRALLRCLLVPGGVEKGGPISLPGLGFSLWLKKGADLAPESVSEKEPPIPRPAEEKPACEAQAPTEMLRIIRICPNPIWVRVQTPDGKTADVRVRHSRLLVPGKRMRCALTPAGWECADRIVSPNPAWR